MSRNHVISFAVVVAVAALIAGSVVWWNSRISYPDVPPLQLPAAGEVVYPAPTSMVTLTLYFKTPLTNESPLLVGIYSQKGVLGVYGDEKNLIYTIKFDPYYQNFGKLLEAIYPHMNNKNLFM